METKTTKIKYAIYDESHCELQEEYDSFEDALNELKRRAEIPWDQEPNAAPCMSWKTCGRNYEIEYDDEKGERQNIPILEISAKGVNWLNKQL